MRKVLLVFFLLGIVATSHAQFGVRAGFNSANFSNTNFDARSGFHFGGFYTFGEGLISVEPGIQFSQKGFETTDDMGVSIEEKLGYLDIPVLFRLNLIPVVNVFLGPQASLLASRFYQKGDETSDNTDPIRGYDLGGVIGAQAKLPLGFNVQASYDFGLSSLNYFDSNVKNQVLKLSLGYTFGGN